MFATGSPGQLISGKMPERDNQSMHNIKLPNVKITRDWDAWKVVNQDLGARCSQLGRSLARRHLLRTRHPRYYTSINSTHIMLENVSFSISVGRARKLQRVISSTTAGYNRLFLPLHRRASTPTLMFCGAQTLIAVHCDKKMCLQ